MGETMKARSAGRRSRASGVFLAGAMDSRDIALTAPEIQARRIAERFPCSPAVAAVLAAHVYGTSEGWGGRSE